MQIINLEAAEQPQALRAFLLTPDEDSDEADEAFVMTVRPVKWTVHQRRLDIVLSPLRCPSAALLYFPLCLLSRCRGCGAVVVSHQGCWWTSYYHSPVRSYMKGFRSHLGPGHGTFDSKKKALLLDAKVGKLVVDIIPVQKPGSGLRIWGDSSESSTCSCIKPWILGGT